MTPDVRSELLLRELTPQVLGAVIRRFRDFAAAEDAVQEALLAAATQWPREGFPENPRGWLIQVASRRMTDHLRRELARRRRESAAAELESTLSASVEPENEAEQDDTLMLLFMCCHAALTPASAIALTLRAVGGLTTAEIASAFLVPEATMAQRISRAKQTIKTSGVPFRTLTHEERAQRLPAVLHVLYLIFNEGYTSSGGPNCCAGSYPVKPSDCAYRSQSASGARRGRGAARADAVDRREACRAERAGRRVDSAHEAGSVAVGQQEIADGVALISATLSKGSIGSYQLQAAIAALHDEAPRAGDTDWPQILAIYELLKRMSDNPMVKLNHAIAAAMVHGPRNGLELLDALDRDGRLNAHHRLDAVRAHSSRWRATIPLPSSIIQLRLAGLRVCRSAIIC